MSSESSQPAQAPTPQEFELPVRAQDMELNFGPQHPATHGVMRVLVRSDGEVVTGAQVHLGYLHRCAEKIGENVEWLMYLPYTDRYDYLSAMNNNLGYSLAVEALMGIKIPRRAELLRVICVELNRIGSHLIAFGTYGLDMGAATPFFYAFREREWMMSLFEKICGARLTYSYIRIGGLFNDAPPGWFEEVARFCEVFDEKWDEYERLLLNNHIFVERTANVGVLSAEQALAFGITGPMLRGSGVDWDLRRDLPYSIYGEIFADGGFSVPVARGEKGKLGDCWDRPERQVGAGDHVGEHALVRQLVDLCEDQVRRVGCVERGQHSRDRIGPDCRREHEVRLVSRDGSQHRLPVRVRVGGAGTPARRVDDDHVAVVQPAEGRWYLALVVDGLERQVADVGVLLQVLQRGHAEGVERDQADPHVAEDAVVQRELHEGRALAGSRGADQRDDKWAAAAATTRLAGK
jgi:NADH-quinone oxidoreductase subunit D